MENKYINNTKARRVGSDKVLSKRTRGYSTRYSSSLSPGAATSNDAEKEQQLSGATSAVASSNYHRTSP